MLRSTNTNKQTAAQAGTFIQWSCEIWNTWMQQRWIIRTAVALCMLTQDITVISCRLTLTTAVLNYNPGHVCKNLFTYSNSCDIIFIEEKPQTRTWSGTSEVSLCGMILIEVMRTGEVPIMWVIQTDTHTHWSPLPVLRGKKAPATEKGIPHSPRL